MAVQSIRWSTHLSLSNVVFIEEKENLRIVEDLY